MKLPMKTGMFGEEVKQLQSLINKFYGKKVLIEDGHFGPKTDYYIKESQRRAGVDANGIVGPYLVKFLGGADIDPDPVAPVNPDLGLERDYPPFAVVTSQRMPERGTYPKGFPFGAVFHYTAGWDGALKTILGGIKNGYTFWDIQRNGELFCAHRVSRWGYHAGESGWVKFAKKLVSTVSNDLIGIEVNAFGTVKPVAGKPGRYVTYFGHEIGADEVRYSPGKENQGKGYYHTYTSAQIATFVKTIMWLKLKNPAVFDLDFVLGHDEVSGPSSGIMSVWRKVDPGAALPWTMPTFRRALHRYYSEVATKPGFTFDQVTYPAFEKFI